MHFYECDSCHYHFEIEDVEATLYPPEHYEYGMCPDCFDKH